MSQKIAVFGTGANGSCIAASLIDAGRDVVLIDQWPAHVEAMRANGLTITMPETEQHVAVRAYHLCDLCTLNTTFDIVLLAMKAYDTRWSCEMIKPHLATDGMLIGMQNAMEAVTIADVVGAERTVGCVIELSSEMFTPGLVKRNTPPQKTWIGLGGSRQAQHAAAENLDRARRPRRQRGRPARRDAGAARAGRQGRDQTEYPGREVDEACR
jgi:2-dehydropantoate 2-reductase